MGASHALEIVEKARKLFKDPRFLAIVNAGVAEKEWRRGGYLCIRLDQQAEMPPLVLIAIGTIATADLAKRYHRNAYEKAERLLSLLQDPSSWMSRNPENGQYGGAIRFDGLIVSFSGLPELADEALSLALRTRPHLSLPQREALLAISRKSGSTDMYRKILALR